LPRSGSAGDGRLSGRVGAPYLVPLALAAAAGLAVWGLRDRLWDLGRQATGSPETQVREALANQVRAHLEDVYGFRSGGTLELVPVRFAEVSPVVQGERAQVTAVLEAEGRAVWRDQAARVSWIGVERFHMHPCPIALWCAEGDQFARLRAVLAALFRRHDALAERAAPVVRRVAGWQVRLEGDVAEVGEDFESAAAGGVGAVRERSRFRLRFDGSRWAEEPAR
jgi:hypothetical protein